MNLNPNNADTLPSNANNSLAVANQQGGEGGTSHQQIPGIVKRKMRVNGQVVCMVIVLAVSAATIHFMRQYGVRAGINFESVPIDYQQPDEAKARTYEKIMADLARIQKPMEVALGDFTDTPFMLDRPVTKVNPNIPNSASMTPDQLAAESERRAAEQKREEMMLTLRNLRLQGVMGGKSPLARISDSTYRVGDVIYETFTIISIEGREIMLDADGERFTLSMQDHESAPGGKVAPMRGNKPRLK